MKLNFLAATTLFILLCACSKSGVQGTDLYSSFQGVAAIEALSPTGIRLTWNLDSKYTSYKVYQNGSVTPLKTETFSSSTISGLTPSTTYSYKVTAVQSDNSEADLGGIMSANTFPTFPGLTTNGVVVKSATEVSLTWNAGNAKIVYKIYKKKKSATWNLTTPMATVTGSNQYTADGLTSGEQYCFYIVANYGDGTSEPTATTEAAVNAIAPCIQVISVMDNVPSINANSVAPGSFPWFWTSGGDSNYKTEIFELDTDVRVASRVGNGTFRSFVKTLEGTKNYYAMVSYQDKISRQQVTYDGLKTKTLSKIRNVSASGDHGPISPPLINGGNGKQNFGSQVVTGDFNCDGLPDLAVSMPTAVIVPSSSHYVDTGAVVVYYSHQLPGPCVDANGDPAVCPTELKTDVAPSATAVFPNPTLITYPATSSSMRLGRLLTTGNFNGDCYERSPDNLRSGNCNTLFATETTLSRLATIKSCDDLVIGLNDGSFNVIYGNPSQGLVAGSGGSSAGQDEFTCDQYSNSCRVVKMSAPTGYTGDGNFASAFASGDYNNDGFDELLVTAKKTATGLTNVLVYRGGGRGLYPVGTSGSHATIDVNDPAQASGLDTLGAILSTDTFGAALGTAYNSRKCVSGTPAGAVYRTTVPAVRKGYDFTKCDDIVIGAPGRSSGRGSIFTCKGNQADATDKQRVTSWTCQEQFPTELTGLTASYGASITGVPNFNGYPVFNIKSNPTNASLEVPEVTGAVFVGAPKTPVTSGGLTYTDAGAVYGYYMTPLSTDYYSGGIQGILGVSSSGHPIEAINSVPCDRLNANKTTGSLRHCNNQKITMSPVESGVKFGTTMGVVPLNSGAALTEESMKMLAIAAPYRTVNNTNGTGYIGSAGSVFLYRPDVSNFGVEGTTSILTPQRSAGQESNYSCTTNCTWYSGGLSPFGPSVFYPTGVNSYGYFGLGGIAGGSFDDDEEGDLVASAPGLNSPAPQSGAAYIFSSNGGFAPSENTPTKTLSTSVGLEGGYRFEETKSLGDINNDGYEDVATHINANGDWSVVIYYGSANGLIKTPAPSQTAVGTQPLLIKLASDKEFGKFFAPAGDMNGDGYADLFVVGQSGSYMYYGSSSGLVAGQEPAVSPIGKGPLKFAMPGVTGSTTNITFYPSGPDLTLPNDASYNASISTTTFGDYNQDSYGDLAIYIAQATQIGNTPAGSMSFLPTQKGRVVVIYGSSIGPQVNRLSGKITTIDGSNNPVDIAVVDPCTTSAPVTCKIQILGPNHTNTTNGFGFALETVKHKVGPTYPLYDRLLISDMNVNTQGGSWDGVVNVIEGSQSGVKNSVLQTLVSRTGSTNAFFGFQILNAGDINGDSYDDLVVASGSTSSPVLTVFYGQQIGGTIGYYGASSISAVDYWTTAVVDNAQHASPTQPRPQVIRPTTLASTDLFGWGLAAMGDFNNDGYADIAVNVPNMDSNLNGLVTGTGSVIIYFGSATGLVSNGVVVSPYPRCYGGVSKTCDPFQVYLPDAVEYENTSIHRYSSGDFNGDGFKDLSIGGVGRDLIIPGQKSATSTGVIYILY